MSGTASRVRELLSLLVSIPSHSGEEKSVADALASWMKDAGVPPNRLDDNLWAATGNARLPDAGPVLLLNSHLDVVPASTGHPYPPFEPTVAGGALWGRGSVDAKGSVAALAVAFAELLDDGWSPGTGQLVAAFTTCEETGWPYNGLSVLRPHLPVIHSAIVGEPTNLRPCIAQKGLLILKVTAKGRSAHAARPSQGSNAIMAAANDLNRLESVVLDRVHDVLGPVTLVPTVIEGGTARNMIPDRCTFWLDIRTTPAYSHREMTSLLADALEGDVEIHSDRLIPVDTAPDAPVVRAALAASAAQPFGSPTLSDWIFLKDVDAVKMGPGESRLSHTSDEHMPLDELTRAVAVYKHTITAFFEAAQ